MNEEKKTMEIRRKEMKPSKFKLWLVLSFSLAVCLGVTAAIVAYAQKRPVTRPAGKNVVIRVGAGGDLAAGDKHCAARRHDRIAGRRVLYRRFCAAV